MEKLHSDSKMYSAGSRCVVMHPVPPSTYLVQSQRVSIPRRDGVDGGVKGHPALATEVKPAERKQKGVTIMTGGAFRDSPFLQNVSDFFCLQSFFLHVDMNFKNSSVNIPSMTRMWRDK